MDHRQKPLPDQPHFKAASNSSIPRLVLVVEDDARVREALLQAFSRDGYVVTAVSTGADALTEAGLRVFDAIILDVALGAGLNGYQVCRILRDRGVASPIIMLTGLASEADAVHGLDTGADDYVRKPVGVSQLKSRVDAILRRSSWDMSKEPIVIGRVVFDQHRQLVTVDGHQVTLTPAERSLLTALVKRAEQAVSREELLRLMWGSDAERDIRSIDLHVRHLRAKLGDNLREPRLIIAVSGQGYLLRLE